MSFPIMPKEFTQSRLAVLFLIRGTMRLCIPWEFNTLLTLVQAKRRQLQCGTPLICATSRSLQRVQRTGQMSRVLLPVQISRLEGREAAMLRPQQNQG